MKKGVGAGILPEIAVILLAHAYCLKSFIMKARAFFLTA
jgi:hypothetical protein